MLCSGGVKMHCESGQTLTWHEDCLQCSVCQIGLRVDNVVFKQKLFCKSCYIEASLNKCDKCSEVITGAGYTFRDKFWHDTCFGCDRCEEIFRCEMRILIILLILSSSAMASSESSGGRNSVINVSKQRQHRDPSHGFSPSTLF